MLLSNNFLPNQSTVKSNQTRAPFQYTFIVIKIFTRIPFHVCLYMLVFGNSSTIYNTINVLDIFTFSNVPFVNVFVKSNGDLISDKNSDPKSKIHSFIILMTIAASTQEFYARYLRAISPQQQIIKSFFIQLYWNIVIVTINEFVRPCEMHTPSFSRCGFCQT